MKTEFPIHRADQTRERILTAAIHHFSRHGLAGARTDAIAGAANVSKALLYYYFESKDKLYSAALQDAASTIEEQSFAAIDAGASAGESLLRLALSHFDRITSQHDFQSLMQQEMVRLRRGGHASIPVLVSSLFGTLLARMQVLVQEGIRSGELCENDWLQVVYCTLGANVFYFLSAPIMRAALRFDPLDKPQLESRRAATIDFLGRALFRDRKDGARLAHRVLVTTPVAGARRPAARRPA